MFINKDPTIPKAIGENLLISAGKKGVRFMPIKDKPKSAIANTIKIIPKICILNFLNKKDISKTNKIFLLLVLLKFKQ
jgi:hypothetical protein